MKTLLEITKSGMDVAQRGLETTSNNIANVNTEGYSRQRLVTKPLFARNGLFERKIKYLFTIRSIVYY